MSVVYVSEQGASIHKNRERIIIRKQGKILQAVHLAQIEQLVLLGYVQVTAPTVHTLLQRGIDTVFLSKNGTFRGRLQSYTGKNIELRQFQFRNSDQPAFLLDLAARIVRGKIQNSRLVLRRQQQRVQSPQVEEVMARLRSCQTRTARATSLDELRGLEGSAALFYFDGVRSVLTNPSIPFRGRSRRPPRDPFNALLSFGYALLQGTINTVIHTVGLDPYLGSLHTPDNGKLSLVFDLMEEFRPILVDSLMIAMVNRGQIHSEDFRVLSDPNSLPVDYQDPDDPRKGESPVYLRRESVKTVVALYESNLNRSVTYQPTGTNLTYRQICLEQARALVRHYVGKEPYQPFTPR